MSKGNRTRRREIGLLPTPVLCSARKRDGTPCGRSPIKGATVCRAHGGASPQVVAAARRRLMASSDRVSALLLQIAEDETTPAPVRLAAIKDVLDRAGVNSKVEVEVTVQPWQGLIDGIVAEADEQAISRGSHLLTGEIVAEVVHPPTPAPGPSPTADQPRIPSRRKRKGSR